MSPNTDKALWARYRRARTAPDANEPGLLQIAEYIDANLDEAGRTTVEAYLASRPEAIALLGPADSTEVPSPLLQRAQGLGGTGRVGIAGRPWTLWYRLPAYAAGAVLFIAASVSAFEMGSATASGTDQIERALVATLTFSDSIEGTLNAPPAVW